MREFRQVRLYSYVVARDFGFAPNPFHGFCTLATCKPTIRVRAAGGDWVVGTGSAPHALRGYLVYAMRVSEVITFDSYWRDPRFGQKKPNLHGSKKQAFGDNIYHRATQHGPWVQSDSHHSLGNGAVNSRNLADDTKTPNVLVSTDFAYFRGSGPAIPAELRTFNGYDLCAGRGYKSNFPAELIEAFVEWFRSLRAEGCLGVPRDWSRTA